ncbi:MAG: hypothetical protein NVS2B16_33180 [Chloroflexota bacterium]
MDLPDREPVLYETVLRSAGAYCDHQGAHHIALLETTEGFTLRYQQAETSAIAVVTFTPAELSGGTTYTRTGLLRSASGYQDFFRALGHELDEENASTILVDELEWGFLLSYRHLDGRNSFQPSKKQLVLGPNQQETILEHARARRAHVPIEKGGLFGWLRG